MKLQCVNCHPGAASSTRVEDDLLPKREACLPCHQDREIPEPPKTRLRSFNHALHLKMGDVAPFIAAAIDKKNYLQPPGEIRAHLNTKNACEACHRGMEEADQPSHALLPQMADCVVCHVKIEPPWSCEQCHGDDPGLRPATHTEHFVNDHSSGKLKLDLTTCAVCHGRQFRCAGCH